MLSYKNMQWRATFQLTYFYQCGLGVNVSNSIRVMSSQTKTKCIFIPYGPHLLRNSWIKFLFSYFGWATIAYRPLVCKTSIDLVFNFRFLVTALPTIYHVKDGVFRLYRGWYVEFVSKLLVGCNFSWPCTLLGQQIQPKQFRTKSKFTYMKNFNST